VSESERSIRLAAAAVVGTVRLCTVLVTQWILPTVTASLNHEIELQKEKISTKDAEISTLKQKGQQLAQSIADEKRKSDQRVSDLTGDVAKLKDDLFLARSANMFLKGDPYPLGFDKVRIGDPLSKINEFYAAKDKTENGKSITIKDASEIFRFVQFRHSSSKNSLGKVDSISFDLGNLGRIVDKSLPRIPKDWLEQSLKRALGEPFVVGTDDNCLLWKTSDNENVVYHLIGSDLFEVSGYVTYPPGCSVSEDQLKQSKARRK